MMDVLGYMLMSLCAVVIIALCVGIAQAYSDMQKLPGSKPSEYDDVPIHWNCRCDDRTMESPVAVVNTVKPKIVIASTRVEIMVIWSDYANADYHLCAAFPTSRPLAARAVAEALAGGDLEIQEHRG